MTDFYRTFEEQFRGSRALIAERAKQYLPLVLPLRTLHASPKVLDVGCGRGEWLEVLSEHGFECEGVDLDEGMLQAGLALGLNVRRDDALRYLPTIADDSLSIVSAFHVAEHLTFAQLRTLIEQALRVLRPGGLLIIETPNPENLMVGANTFYLDPTHQKPLPQKLLRFAVEHAGFAATAIIGLNESKALRATPPPTLMDVLGGVSPDYAVIGQKAGEGAKLPGEATMSREHGLSLAELCERFESRLTHLPDGPHGTNARIDALEQTLTRLRVRVQDLEVKNVAIEAQNRSLQSQLDASGRPYWLSKLLFRPDGRPVRFLRKLLFHSSGKPRGAFRSIVLGIDGRPKPAFRQWMASPSYLTLREAVQSPVREVSLAAIEPAWKAVADAGSLSEEEVDHLMAMIRAELAAAE